MASIKRRPERGNKWQATYRDPSGRERAKLFERKVDAERWLASVQHELHSGTYIDPLAAKTTLSTYAARWLERMTPTWRSATAGGVDVSLNKHVLPVLGAVPLSGIRRSDVEALCAALPLAPSTVEVVHQHLSQLLAGAVEDGIIARNPASRARLPKKEPSKAQPVPVETVARIAAALPDWLKVAVPLGVGVGLRQGEASGLSVDRIDFLRRTLRVDRQLVNRYVPAPVLTPPKTSSSNRTIPLAAFVVEALADHLRQFPAGPTELILRDPHGRPVDSDRFGNQWRRACREAGAPGLRYHDLRHTFASTLLSRGVSIKAVCDWLGHASPTITLSTYAHLMPADEDVARAVLDAALASHADQARTTDLAAGL